jgi:hypothetical protein
VSSGLVYLGEDELYFQGWYLPTDRPVQVNGHDLNVAFFKTQEGKWKLCLSGRLRRVRMFDEEYETIEEARAEAELVIKAEDARDRLGAPT